MSDLQAGLGVSTAQDVKQAVAEAVRSATEQLGGRAPRLAIVTSTIEHDATEVHSEIRSALPNVPLHGATTSLGVLSSRIATGKNGAIGVMLLSSDGDVAFASGSAAIDGDGRRAGAQAATQVKERLGGRTARMLYIAGSPGSEEDILAGIADVLPNVPVFGGSAADNAITGGWSVFMDEGVSPNALSLAAVAGDVRIGAALGGPYEPSGIEAEIAESTGRTLARLGERPAAEVLNGWVDDAIGAQVREGGNILVQMALTPLGIAHASGDTSFYTLLHPAHAHSDGRVDLFARADQGQTVCLMRGSPESLGKILDDVATRALAASGLRVEEVRAALVIYCAGCAGAVGGGLEASLARLGDRFRGVPIIGRCTFGEQGHVPGIGNVHTNLSASVVLLG